MKRLLLGFAAALSFAATAQAADLTVTIDGVRSADGYVMVALFDGEDAFKERKGEVAALRLRAREGQVSATLHDLPAGDYGFAVYHDENGNSELDANLLGMPTEGYTFSNDARGSFGPPGFADAKFGLDAEPLQMTATLSY